MINLFEKYSKKEQLIISTLEAANIKNKTIILEDDGFLPESFESPYKYFANNKSNEKKPLFFNQVKIPQYWTISGDNNSGKVLHGETMKGKINYEKGSEIRIVKYVEWYDNKQRINHIDHYDQYGIKYAETLLDTNGKTILKRFFTHDGRLLYYRNYIINNVVLNFDGKIHLFESYVSFLLYYYRCIQLEKSEIIMNSLGLPLTSTYNLGIKVPKYVIWQEEVGNNIPLNMIQILKDNNRSYKILVPDQYEYNNILGKIDVNTDKILSYGYILKTFKEIDSIKNNKNVLILTNSDNINNINNIVNTCKHITFHIAALTEMSSKLTKLGENNNVKLYPNIKKDMIKKLYQKCSIYLDINQGNEIMNAVRMAFDYNMLIVANSDVLHNKYFTDRDNIFLPNEVDEIIKLLNDVTNENNANLIKEKIIKQRQTANIVEPKLIKERILNH